MREPAMDMHTLAVAKLLAQLVAYKYSNAPNYRETQKFAVFQSGRQLFGLLFSSWLLMANNLG